MTQEQIKEQLSFRYLEIIVNKIGHKVVPIPQDHAVDIEIREVEKRTLSNGKARYSDSGRNIDIQMKSTTDDKVVLSNEFLNIANQYKKN